MDLHPYNTKRHDTTCHDNFFKNNIRNEIGRVYNLKPCSNVMAWQVEGWTNKIIPSNSIITWGTNKNSKQRDGNMMTTWWYCNE